MPCLSIAAIGAFVTGRRFNRGCSVALLVFLSVLAPHAIAQPSWQVFQLTSGNVVDTSPAVSGTTYVWRRGSGSFAEIYKWTEGEASPTLISQDTRESAPRISGSRVLWQSSEDGDFEIIEWKNGTLSALTANTIDDKDPDLGGFGTVWNITNQHILYDDGIQQTQVTASFPGADEFPRVMNDVVVWEASTTGGTSEKEILRWTTGTTTQLTNDGFRDSRPDTDGTSVVWFSARGPGGSNEIMRWTPSAGIVQLTANTTDDTQPSVSGDVVVYAGFDGSDYEIFAYYFGKHYQLSDNTFDDFEPDIDGDRVVWQGQPPTGDRHIYYAILAGFDGGTPIGACCAGLACTRLTEAQCLAQSGTYNGDETLCLLDSCPDAIAPASSWSTYQSNTKRNGRISAIVPHSPNRVWSLQVGGGGDGDENFNPSIGPDGTILVEGGLGYVAVSVDGTLRWTINTFDVPRAAPSIRGDGNFFLPQNTSLSKRNSTDGSELCVVAGGSFSPAIDEQGNFYHTDGNTLSRSDSGCNPDWSFLLPQVATSPVALSPEGGAYVVNAVTLTRVNAATGLLDWHFSVPETLGPVAIGDDGTAYVMQVPDKLIAIDTAGAEKWTFTIPGVDTLGTPAAPAIGSDETIYVTASTSPNKEPVIVAVSPLGNEVWRHVEAGSQPINPFPAAVDGNNTVLFPMNANLAFPGIDLQSWYVIAFDGLTGTEQWRVPLGIGAHARAPLGIANDGTMYVITSKGLLLAFGSGAAEPEPRRPPFKYRKVVNQHDVIQGTEVQSVDRLEILEDGRVVFASVFPNGGSAYTERGDGTFELIKRGTVVGNHVLDAVTFPRYDANGNRYMGASLEGSGPAILVNQEAFASERSTANPLFQVNIIEDLDFVTPNDLGEFLILIREPDLTRVLYSATIDPPTMTPVLQTGTLIEGFNVQSIDPKAKDCFENDGIPVTLASLDQPAIVTPTDVLIRRGDLVEGIALGTIDTPRRTAGGDVYLMATQAANGIVQVSSTAPPRFARNAGDTVESVPLLDIRSHAVNDFGNLVIEATTLADRAILYDDLIVAAPGLTEINGVEVTRIEPGGEESVSVNNAREVAFVAQKEGESFGIFVATLLLFDVDFNESVNETDLLSIAGCFDGATLDVCACAVVSSGVWDVEGDCCATWNELKRTWNGPPQFPPLSPLCDEDCNSNGIADEMEIAAAIVPDCNGNTVPDNCDIAAGIDTDLDGDGHLDGCCAPPLVLPGDALGERNRFLTLAVPQGVAEASPFGASQAVRVTLAALAPPFDVLNNTMLWVGPHFDVCENSGQGPEVATEACTALPAGMASTLRIAPLQCDPHFLPWHELGTFSVLDERIIPGSTYNVQLVFETCGIDAELDFSAPLAVSTSLWGDLTENCSSIPCLPPDGSIDVTTDVSAVLDKFRNLESGPSKTRTDLEPGILDLKINISDVTVCLDAFKGSPYPFAVPQMPCP